MHLDVHTLGPLEVRVDGSVVPIGGRRQRAVLAALIVNRKDPVSADRLVDLVWGAEAPPTAAGTLQAYLSRLRRALGGEVITKDTSGYQLHLGASDFDLTTFEALVSQADRAREEGDSEGAKQRYATALDLWRGDRFLGELGAEPFAVPEATRLERLRLHALRGRIDADLDLGRHEEVTAELEAAVRSHPFDEHLWSQLILAHYRSGRQVEALQAHRRAARLLRDEIGVEPGPRLLSLERRILQQDPTLAARVTDVERRTGATNPTNLRSVTTGFVGREQELDALRDLLDASRVVTVVGPGGVGKTRLAVEACWTVLGDTPGGVWDIDLALETDPQRISRPLAAALEIPYRTGPVGLRLMTDRIGDRPTVILLDNCEHVLDAARDLVTSLSPSCPGLAIVATSREALSVDGEALLSLQPLALPAIDDIDPEAVNGSPAVTLFAQRATAVVPGFRVTAANREAVTTVVRRLDGLPLAIELAAATLELLTPRQLSERLVAGFPDLMALESGDARHETLRAAIDWSYDLLPHSAQRVLDRLAVFAGPFDADGAIAVGAATPVTADEVPGALQALVRRSLVAPADPAPSGEDRHRLLELVRQYGIARLSARGDLEEARTRHLEYVSDLVDRAATHLHDQQQPAAYNDLRAADAEIHAALRTAADRGDVKRLRSLAADLWLWWYLDARIDDAITWMDRATSGADPPPLLVAASAVVHTELLESEGFERAFVLADQALALPTRGPDEEAHVALLVGDALTAALERQVEAEQLLEGAARYFRKAGPAWAEGWALMRLVRVDGFRADRDSGQAHLDRSLELLREAGDLHLLAYGQLIRANISRLHGSLAEGLEATAEPIRHYETLGLQMPLQETRMVEASLMTEMGRLDDAAARWRGLLADADRTGSRAIRFRAELGLAEVHARAGSHDEASVLLEAQLAAHETSADADEVGRILTLLAPVAALTAHSDEERARAEHFAARALQVWGQGPMPWFEIEALLAASQTAMVLGDHEEAAGLLRRAASRAVQAQQPQRLAAAAEGCAALAHGRGDHETVARLLGGAFQLRDDAGAPPWQYVAERNAQLIRDARRHLGADAFATSWHEGAASGMELLTPTT